MQTTRQRLIDMANGNRPGYWVEILRTADGGQICYGLHRPTMDAEAAAALASQMPYTWEALQILAAKYLGREDAADTLEQYDDGRTTTARPMEASQAKALAKWIQV